MKVTFSKIPRNPLVARSLFRLAGAHRKSTKALRAQQRREDKKRINSHLEE